jgi:hypothetical protein
MASFFPMVGSWFMNTQTDQRFEIVAIDEKQKTIEVQYYDGDIDEFDIESWGALSVIETETPEAAYSGYDGVSVFRDDDAFVVETFSNPIESIEPETFTGFDDLM